MALGNARPGGGLAQTLVCGADVHALIGREDADGDVNVVLLDDALWCLDCR